MVEISSIFNFSTLKSYMNGSAKGRPNPVIPVLLPVGKVIYLTASHMYTCAPQLVARAGRQSIFLEALELESIIFYKMMIFEIFKNRDFLNISFCTY